MIVEFKKKTTRTIFNYICNENIISLPKTNRKDLFPSRNFTFFNGSFENKNLLLCEIFMLLRYKKSRFPVK